MSLSETDTIPTPPIIPNVARALSPLVRRVASCSANTEDPGLNTYLVGIDEIVVIDPGPSQDDHLDVLCGCGGDRIKWIILTDMSEDYSAGASFIKKKTGAEIIATASFEGADQTLGDGFKIDATEFRLTALAMDDSVGEKFAFVLEQERTLLTGDHVEIDLDADEPKVILSNILKKKVKPYRIKSIAPGHGQFIEDARDMLR